MCAKMRGACQIFLLLFFYVNIFSFVRIAYVVNQDSATVTPVNLETYMPLAPIFLGGSPNSIVITHDSKTAFVTNSSLHSVQRIDLITNTVTANIFLGNLASPLGLAITPDDATVWVADLSNKIIPIDVATNTVGAPISTGAGTSPLDIKLTSDGTQAYVSLFFNNKVILVDLVAQTIIAQTSVDPFANKLVITRDDATVYVSNEFSSEVTPIDTLTHAAQTPITVGMQPDGLAITPSGDRIYVANTSSNTISVINVATNTVIATLPSINNPVGIGIDERGEKAVITLSNGASVQILNIITNTYEAQVPVGAFPVSVAIAHVQPFPPTSFSGHVRSNRFLDRSEYILEVTIGPSTDPVQFYRIFKNDVLVLETSKLSALFCLGTSINVGGFSIASVFNGSQSERIPLHIG